MNYRHYSFIIIILLAITSWTFPQTREQLPTARIGIILDGAWERNEQYFRLFQGEILELTRGEFDVRFPEDKRIEADWTIQGVNAAVNELLADPSVDLILALGLIVAEDVATRRSLSKPIIIPFVLDAELLGFPLIEGASGIKNFSYVNIPDNIVNDVQSFLHVVPFEKLVYFINDRYLEAIPQLSTRGNQMLKAIGIDFQVIGVGETIDRALTQLSPESEAVLLGPLTSTPEKEFTRLVDELKKRNLPSFSGFEVGDVEKGILACVVSNIFPHVARRTALNIQRILLGEEPGSIPVNIEIGRQLTINMDTARAIDIFPDWSVLTEAELLNEERSDLERKLDLNSVVQEALETNLDLASKERFVAAGFQNVKEARSKLYPQLNVSGSGVVIDQDRAEASFGSQAERSLTGSLSATQIIFSEPVWANLSIQNSLQITREQEYEQLKLDIILEASTAYLNVLRAKTFERIQRDNLMRTRANLKIARIRESAEIAGPAEVYRWESEMSSNQKAVIQANAQRNLAEIELNRLLNRPLEEPFLTLEANLDEHILYTSEQDYIRYTKNKKTFKLFRDFMVAEGLLASPELASLNAVINAQERILRSASNSFWSPTLALQGDVSNVFSKGGAGASSTLSLPPPFIFPEIDDTSWSVAFVLSFPLFKGGEKFAVQTKAEKELEQLQLQKKAMDERIKQRIRSALHLTGASFVSIEMAQKAADAAQKSLEVVQNAYETGAVSILFLLDAQNASYITDQVAANAVYEFLIDLMRMERSIGRFEFFLSDQERKAGLMRMKAFFEKSGISLEKK